MAPPNSNPIDTAASERLHLRRTLRQLRARMTAPQRATAARRIAVHVAASRWLHGRRPIALYASVGSEVDTEPLMRAALRRRCPVYLPRIADYQSRRLQFVLHSSPTKRNRYGIPEPHGRRFISARALSVVFLPLLGFDALGTRLGSGAGYYDRLLSFRRHRLHWQRPLLVGIAYRCQELPHIQPQRHDVPLDALVTEDGVRYFRQGGSRQ